MDTIPEFKVGDILIHTHENSVKEEPTTIIIIADSIPNEKGTFFGTIMDSVSASRLEIGRPSEVWAINSFEPLNPYNETIDYELSKIEEGLSKLEQKLSL